MKDLNLDFQDKEKKKYKKKKEVRVQLDDNYYSMLRLIAKDEYRTIKATAENILIRSLEATQSIMLK